LNELNMENARLTESRPRVFDQHHSPKVTTDNLMVLEIERANGMEESALSGERLGLEGTVTRKIKCSDCCKAGWAGWPARWTA